jgi:hypothetical protein
MAFFLRNKELVFDLMKHDLAIELCGAAATVHKRGNADLLPGEGKVENIQCFCGLPNRAGDDL